MNSRLRNIGVAAVALVVATLSLSACASNKEGGGSPSGSVTGTVSKKEDLSALVPAKIKSAGKLVVGVNVPHTTNEYKQNGKLVGFDVDLMHDTPKVLGLITEYREADFTKIVPAVEAGTYDIGMSSFTDNKVREQTVDFVDYFSAGIQWAAASGKTVDPTNACGLKVSVQSGTTESDDELPAKSKACTSAGKKAITIVKYENQDDATNALTLGKVDALSADSPVTLYAIKQSGGKLVKAGDVMEAAPYGWKIDADLSQLVQAMQKALQSIIDGGVYDQICKKWGLQDGEIKTASVNGAIS
jgi:polar amino acid transport system substrate-binding protein